MCSSPQESLRNVLEDVDVLNETETLPQPLFPKRTKPTIIPQ